MSTATRARLVAALLLMLVAGAGFAAGMFTEHVLLAAPGGVATPPAPAADGFRILIRGQDSLPADGARRLRVLLPERMAEVLDLTPGQRAEIERIVREDQAAIRGIINRVEPELMAAIEQSRQRIFDVLSEEQIDRWHAAPLLRLRSGAQQPILNPDPR